VGVVVAGLVVVGGGDVEGAGPWWVSARGVGTDAVGGAGEAAPPWSATSTLGGGATVARVDGAGASAAAGPGAGAVGVVLVRFVELLASRIKKVTAANPMRKAATHAPIRSAFRVRALRGRSSSLPPGAEPVEMSCALVWRRSNASRTDAGVTGTPPAFLRSPTGETRRSQRPTACSS
jgi:hypothetical protein